MDYSVVCYNTRFNFDVCKLMSLVSAFNVIASITDVINLHLTCVRVFIATEKLACDI